MAETIEALSIERTDELGKKTTRQLDKEVLTRGAWTTIVYRYQDWDNKTDDWGPQKARIERYKKYQGEYRSQSRFNISNAKQARMLIDILSRWFSQEDE